MGRALAHMGEMSNVNKIHLKNLKGRDCFGDRHKWGNNNIKRDLKETGHQGVDWIHVAQDRVEWSDLEYSYGSMKVEFLEYMSDY
jgi:hypothetical protein